MAFVVLCVSFGIAGGLVGRLKGGSFLIWFLVAGVPPWIGLVAAVLMRDQRNELHRACPTCGKVVPLHDALCTRCGTELEFPAAAPTQPLVN